MEPCLLLPSVPSEPTRILKQPEYKVVQRGRSVVFECKVKHDPSLIPTMTWLKDDGELPDDERWEPAADVSRPQIVASWSVCLSSLMRWNADGECFVSRLLIDSDSLTILDVTEDDAGVYTCIMNTTLDHDSASAELTVVGECGFAGARFHRLIKQTLKWLNSPPQVYSEKWIHPLTYTADLPLSSSRVIAWEFTLEGRADLACYRVSSVNIWLLPSQRAR